VVGGPAALVASLERAARHYGVEVRTGAAVTSVVVDDGRAAGVELEGGERVAAATVLASCDPRTALLDLLPTGSLGYAAVRRTEQFRMRGTTATVNLALSKPLPADRPFEYARTGEHLDFLERAFDAVKYRRFSERPSLGIAVTGAPAGHAALSIMVDFAPHHLDGGWTDEARERLGDAVVAELDRHFPGAADSVVAREVLSPADIETHYGITGGHIHHGEHALDQLVVRPTIDAARYRTPVPGLYLCGSGSHPGGGVTCAPGFLAAQAVE
jgi:phytoene dehydrogenase-like protein